MKNILTFALLVLVAASIVNGQTNSQKTASRTAKIAEEIKRLEREWLVESYSSKDMAAYDRNVAEAFTITHSNGKLLNKAQKRADIVGNHSEPSQSSPDSVFKIEDSSVQVRVYKDVAISTGYIIEKYPYQGRQINDRVHFTNTYLKRRGRWQVVSSQLTRVKQS